MNAHKLENGIAGEPPGHARSHVYFIFATRYSVENRKQIRILLTCALSATTSARGYLIHPDNFVPMAPG